MDHDPSVLASDLHNPATTSILERRPRTLKFGDTFAVFDHHGNISGAFRASEGLFHNDTRYISQTSFMVEGRPMLLLSSNLQDDNAVLTVDLANPDIYHNGDLVLSREIVHVTRVKFLWRSYCYERISVGNFDLHDHKLNFSYSFEADFADLFEIRGATRERRGTVSIEHPSDSSVIFRYAGLDGVERTTRIDFSLKPSSIKHNQAHFQVNLKAHERLSLFVTIRCDDMEPTKDTEFFSRYRMAKKASRRAVERGAGIHTSNAMLNRAFARSYADLYMLLTDKPDGPYPYAGIPWFSTVFGRDGIITALQMLWIDPMIAKGVLKFLAATQATEIDDAMEAEPGKILHEMRRSEMAMLGEVPFRQYYGTIDATPLFIILAARYFERTGDDATIAEIWPNIISALKWIDEYGDSDKDGFVEYMAHGTKGLINQGWKDSSDSVSHSDGTLAAGSVALCEVQAYVYAAKREAAQLFRMRTDERSAQILDEQAETLRQRFEKEFWCEEIGTYALALDGDKRQCRVRSSNAGHTLFTGIASHAHAERLVNTLFSRESFSGWGIRTLSWAERRYNPMSYHNGSIWPHDNALIALGLSRYGYKYHAGLLFQSMFEAAQHMDLLRLPELFCGFKRRRNGAPTMYPVACSPQSWASASLLTFLEASLGLQFDAQHNEIRFNKPFLPNFVDHVHIHSLRLNDSLMDIMFHRYGEDVALNVTQRSGNAKIITIK